MNVKRGALCAGSFEPGNAIYWEVRREGAPCGTGPAKRVWLLYRTSVACMLMGEYEDAGAAYNEWFKHVEHSGPTLESSMNN